MPDLRSRLKKILLEEFSPSKDAFIEIESELRSNAKQLGINYDNALIINSNSRIKSPTDIGDWSKHLKQWVGFGSSWLEWIADNLPHKLANYFYVITIDSSKVIQVTDLATKQAFEKKYILNPDSPKDKAIKFDLLYKEGFSGVSFRPYNKSLGNNDWYSSIDVDSLVIINNKAIRSVKLLLDASEIIADYKNQNNF